MKEIEVKILEIDPVKLVAKLKELGAKKLEKGIFYVTAFDFEDDRLMKQGSFVRVRKFNNRGELVLKKPMESQGDYKIMEEIESNISDYEAVVRLFEVLGMKTFAKQETYRASYKLGNLKFEFDKHPTMPWLIEVEAPTEEDVKKGVEMLGFTMADTTIESGLKLFQKYGRDNFFTFEQHGETPDYDKIFED